jgi:phosphoserine phosphatase RsbU/P
MPDDGDAKRMVCMEVWGGSEPVDSAVSLPGLDAWVYSRPYQQTGNGGGGGDVYYASACASGRINRLLVADVSGHGQAVSAIGLQLRNLMRRYVNYIDQSKFVLSMNRQFVASSQAGCFATAVVTTFFAPTRTLTVCNAGHPPPLVWRSQSGEWSVLNLARHEGETITNLPLGIVDLDDCEQFAIELAVGDLVLIYTDAFIEAKDASGEMLGVIGLLDLVRSTGNPREPRRFVQEIVQAVEARTNGGLAGDDVTALLLHANGTGARPSFFKWAAAPLRVLTSIAGAAMGRGPAGLPDMRLANIGGAILAPLNRLWRRQK